MEALYYVMACKLREARLSLWETICRRVHGDWDNPILNYYYLEIEYHGHYDQLYRDAYTRLYGAEAGAKHAFLFEFAGVNCEEFVKHVIAGMVEEGDRDFYRFAVGLFGFLQRQFDFIGGNAVVAAELGCTCRGAAAAAVACGGDGTCLHYCHECTSENDEHTEVDPRTLHTDGPEHNCLIPCAHGCVPLECANFRMCQKMIPAWAAAVNGGVCYNCRWYYGKIEFASSVGAPASAECVICCEERPLVRIFCGHELCLDCWKTISKREATYIKAPCCPLCRRATV